MNSISIITPLNQLGYGQVGINLTLELSKFCKLSLFPIGQIGNINKNEKKIITSCLNNAKMPDFDAPTVRIWHQHDMSQFVGRGPRIGFPIFELDRFTDQEKHHLNNLDSVIVCSQWAKEIVCKETRHSENKVFVAPLGVNNYGIKPVITDGSTKFFTCGKWEIRKGHDIIVKAFNQAFEEDDDVELHMMCDNPFLSPKQQKEWENLYLDSDLGHKVRFVSRVSEHKQVLEIMSKMDCGVFVSRAEGWNLELLEMMSLGKEVIATICTAHQEFCDENNSCPIHVFGLEDAHDEIWFHGQGRWGTLDDTHIEGIANNMKRIHESKTSGRLSPNLFGISTGEKYTWENTAKEILNAIKYT